IPSSPGTSIERVSPSVDRKIHANGSAPAVSIAPECFRKVRLEVIMRHHSSEQLRACSEHVPGNAKLILNVTPPARKRREAKTRAGGSLKELPPSERVDEVDLLTL